MLRHGRSASSWATSRSAAGSSPASDSACRSWASWTSRIAAASATARIESSVSSLAEDGELLEPVGQRGEVLLHRDDRLLDLPRAAAVLEGLPELLERSRERRAAREPVVERLDLAQALAARRELLVDGVGEGVVVRLEVEVEVVLEEVADGDLVARRDLALPGREDVGAAEVAIQPEEVAGARVVDGGDLGLTVGPDADLAGPEQAGEAGPDHVHRVAVGRPAEVRDDGRRRSSPSTSR